MKIPKSRTGSGDLKHNATRPWKKATSREHFEPTPHSSTGRGGQLAGAAREEKATSFDHFKPTKHSGAEGMGAPRAAKKWHKKGFDMTSPS